MKKLMIPIALMLLVIPGCAGVNHGHHGTYTTPVQARQIAENVSQQVYDNNWAGSLVQVKNIVETEVENAQQQTYQDLRNLATLQAPIVFETGSKFLMGHARIMLTRKSEIMKQYPKVGLILVGRADAPGSSGTNLRLSYGRAFVAKHYLIAAGVDPSRMTIVSRGEADSAQKQAGDRVVEFRAVMMTDKNDLVETKPGGSRVNVLEAIRKKQVADRRVKTQ